MCDFHIWYEARFNPGDPWVKKGPEAVVPYEDFGGYYRYWITDERGAVPEHLELLKQETLGADMKRVLQPFADHALPDVPWVNKGPSHFPWPEYYTPQAVDLVEAKFRWTFESGLYQKVPR